MARITTSAAAEIEVNSRGLEFRDGFSVTKIVARGTDSGEVVDRLNEFTRDVTNAVNKLIEQYNADIGS